ncbi:nuclear transport factor 2 family protein [soil metagenome]
MLAGAGKSPPGDAVRDAEARRLRALVASDYEALDLLLADELTYTHTTAKVDDKAAYLEPLRSGRTRYTSLEPEGVQVRTFGSTAVVTGTIRSVALVAGKESRTHMRFTNVWVQRGGRWQMVAWQSTRMPDP